jgi:hypothetical protein
VLVIFLSLLNCGSDDYSSTVCTDVFVYGLEVTVRDAQSGALITEGITVTAREDAYEEQLVNISQLDYFFGAGERPGTYIIEISGTNYETFISEAVKVTADNCHVETEILEYSIIPN